MGKTGKQQSKTSTAKNPKDRPANIQINTWNRHINWGRGSKNAQEKRIKPDSQHSNTKTNARQREKRKKSTKTAKQHSDNAMQKKKGTTTWALFVLKKMQTKRKRRNKKRKHQGKNISNVQQTCDEPQKPARAPKRQNTTTIGQPWQPSRLPTEQQYFFRFQFLKKNRPIKILK